MAGMVKRNNRNPVGPAGATLRQWRTRGYTVTLEPDLTVVVTGPRPRDPAALEAWLGKPNNERALRHDLVAELQAVAGLSAVLRDARVKAVRDASGDEPVGRVRVEWEN